ncbi:MAG: aminotransferase class IV [Gemmataceae bacterium]|nr:aminotransferase class IV [Gemmataceae bacterium]MCI0737741.1 aminotransferase class IV [Gemmataceae bacterium]
MDEPIVFFHGQFLPQSQASLPLNDAGFVWGATVTDLCRTFHHKLYRWPDHLARFRQSCRLADIEVRCTDAQITESAVALTVQNSKLLTSGQELCLVLFATPGPVGYYLGEPGGAGDGATTFGMYTFPLPFARYRPLIEKGASLVIPSVRHVPMACIDPRIKMRSRMHWWLAEREVRRTNPGATALLLDTDGYVTETATANVVVVRANTILSPPLDRILNGISLQVARELCAELGLGFEEQPLLPKDLVDADEILLLSTPYCVVSVSRITGQVVRCQGPVFSRLLQAWNVQVGLGIHEQILPGAKE